MIVHVGDTKRTGIWFEPITVVAALPSCRERVRMPEVQSYNMKPLSLSQKNCHPFGMTLRMANHSDAPSIAAISIEVWMGTYLKKGVNAIFANYALEEFTVHKVSNLINDPAQFILVSQNEDGIDGFIRVSFRSPAPVRGCSDIEISTFYVQPRHQRKGIGKRLLSAALEHCRDTFVESVWLTTNAENDPAIAFYLAQGFEHIGETNFYIDDKGYLNNVYRLTFH